MTSATSPSIGTRSPQAESRQDSALQPRQCAESPRTSTLRVAIGSADGKFVHEHFGRATRFQIFDLNGDMLRFVETRLAEPACQRDGHDDRQLERVVDLVSDANVVLVAAIGPAAEAALFARGIRAYVVQDFIPDALRALQKAVLRSDLRANQQFRRTHQ